MQRLRRRHTFQPAPIEQDRGHHRYAKLVGSAKCSLVRRSVATAAQRRAEILGVQIKLYSDVGQHLRSPNVALLDKERAIYLFGVALPKTTLGGIRETFEGQPAVGLRRDPGKHDVDALRSAIG